MEFNTSVWIMQKRDFYVINSGLTFKKSPSLSVISQTLQPKI